MGETGAAGATAHLTSVSDSGVDLSTQVFREVAESVPPIDWDDWELGQQMQRVRRLASVPSSPPQHPSWDPQHIVRYDASHGRPTEAVPPAETPAEKPTDTRSPRPSSDEHLPGSARRAPGAWIALALGLAASACGGLLMAKSLLEGRGDLWSVGVPLLAAGQFGLVVGLALQLFLGRRSEPHTTGQRSQHGPSPGVQTSRVTD